MKVKTLHLASFSIAVMLLQFAFANAVQAQRFGGGPTMMVQLLAMEKVQEELKLDKETAGKATELAEELRAEMREKMMSLFQDSDGDRSGMREKMAVVQKEFAAKEKEPVEELLNDDQMKRLKQLLIQHQGVQVLAQKEFATSIGVSDDEFKTMKEKYDEISQENNAKMMELFQEGDREGAMKARTEGNEKLTSTMMEMLSDDQRKKLEEAKGAKFEFPEERRGGGRRGGGGRPRNDF